MSPSATGIIGDNVTTQARLGRVTDVYNSPAMISKDGECTEALARGANLGAIAPKWVP